MLMLHYIESVDGQFPVQTATHSFTILGPTIFAANDVSHRQTSVEYNVDGPALLQYNFEALEYR